MVSRRRLRNGFVVAFVILIMNTQPALFGHLFNELFVLLPLAGLVLVYIALGYRIVAARSKRVLLGITAAFVLWVVFQIAILNPAGWYTLLIVAVTIPTVVLGSTLLITNRDTELVLKTIITVIALLSISQFVTYSLIFLGFEKSILIMQKDTEKDLMVGMISPIKLYFPYTFTVHFIKIAGQRIERAVGLYREPGLYQMFIVISYFALDFIRVKRRKFLRGLFIFSLLSTFSTAGYANLIGCLVYKNLLIRQKNWLIRLVLLIVLAGLLEAFISFPFLGLQDKMLTNTKRFSSPSVSWDLLLKRPILGYSVTSVEQGVLGERMGVNFLTSLHKLGFVGLGLYLGLIVFVVRWHYTRQTLVLLLPVLSTLLLSQPIYTTAFVFFMLFLSTRHLEVFEGKTRDKRRPLKIKIVKQPLLVREC